MKHKVHNIGVAQQIARYSDAIETTSHLRWLHPSGTPGLTETGELPKDITSAVFQIFPKRSKGLPIKFASLKRGIESYRDRLEIN